MIFVMCFVYTKQIHNEMEEHILFPYSWHIDDKEEEVTCMRIYGLNKKDENICLRVDNFTPYVFIELPTNTYIKWTQGLAQRVVTKIDELMHQNKPIQKTFTMRKRLYGADLDDNGKYKRFPYIFCTFSTKKDIKKLSYISMKPLYISGLGSIKIKLHESDANEILQLTSVRNIQTAGWVRIKGRRIDDTDKVTRCHHEFSVKYKHITPVDDDIVPNPKIMGFDIEVNSTNPSAMPRASNIGDKVFQISCVVSRYGDTPEQYKKYLLSLGCPDQDTVGKDVTVRTFISEASLLVGYTDLVNEENPNLIVGYNILGFDIPYMIERAKTDISMCIDEFDVQGFHIHAHAREKTIKWTSAAYKNQEFQFLDTEGRVYVDLLPLVKRDFKFNNYKLKTIAEHFIGQTKDPLSVKGIFKCYRIGIKKTDGLYSDKSKKAMGIVGKYCICSDTPISLTHGNVPIQDLHIDFQEVMSWNPYTYKIQYAKQTHFYNNGVKQCIQLTTEDGRKITCTPDHQLGTLSGWVDASKIPISSFILSGPLLPNVSIDTYNSVVARIQGYISLHSSNSLLFNNYIDASNFSIDIETITNRKPVIKCEKNRWVIKYPNNIRNVYTPFTDKNKKREYLAGLFGSNGFTPTYKDGIYTAIVGVGLTFKGNKQNKIYKKVIIDLLHDFNIRATARLDNSDNVHILIYNEDIQLFTSTIGFRYNTVHTLRMTPICMFQTTRPDTSFHSFLEKRGLLFMYKHDYFIINEIPTIPVKLIRRKRVGKKQVYDITVGYTHSFLANGFVAHNCVQDSALTVLLMDKLQTWVGLTEMAKTCRVPIFSLYTQGQQIKVYSQLYKYCFDNQIVVEKDGYDVPDDERYVGAHVFPPVPGQYKNVIPFDFASLYPTTIIAYNIDYHTWVPDGSTISNDKCHVMKWEDHIGCEHCPKVIRKTTLTAYIDKERNVIKKLREKRNKSMDQIRRKEIMTSINQKIDELKPYITERSDINKSKPKNPMCAKRSYRFLKEPKGVLPTIIQNLLDARARTRKVDIVACKRKLDALNETDPERKNIEKIISVLQHRQLAYKVSANSMYGAMGVRKGYLPFMPGAMCTTYMGRVNIELVAKTIVEQYNGELIYGDTDSNYIHFPEMAGKSTPELWDYAEHVSNEVTKLFPDPIKLEFEEAIYVFFFILTKKRYMYRSIDSREGKVSSKIGRKGVLLARRDNSKFVRTIYEEVITHIADDYPHDYIIDNVIRHINDLCSGVKNYTDFIITKSVGATGNLKPEEVVNEKGELKAKVGDYTVPLLSNDIETRNEQLHKKGAHDEEDFYRLCLPAQVQLAERMKRRGQRVDPGSRLEYIITHPDNHTGKQYEKIEGVDYYKKHKDVIQIDYLYYLKALANPLDQVLNVAFKKDKKWNSDFILEQYKYRSKTRMNVMKELKQMFKPQLLF